MTKREAGIRCEGDSGLDPIPCRHCGKPADAQDDNGTWLCVDCMYDAADPDTIARIAIENGDET